MVHQAGVLTTSRLWEVGSRSRFGTNHATLLSSSTTELPAIWNLPGPSNQFPRSAESSLAKFVQQTVPSHFAPPHSRSSPPRSPRPALGPRFVRQALARRSSPRPLHQKRLPGNGLRSRAAFSHSHAARDLWRNDVEEKGGALGAASLVNTRRADGLAELPWLELERRMHVVRRS